MEVCFTKDELSVLSKKAKKAGMSIGGFVRRSVADKEIKEAPPADIPMLLRAMRQAGYNLDQTLKRFNATNVPDMPQFRKDLEGIRAATKIVSDAYIGSFLGFYFVGGIFHHALDFMKLRKSFLVMGFFRIAGVVDDLVHPSFYGPD